VSRVQIEYRVNIDQLLELIIDISAFTKDRAFKHPYDASVTETETRGTVIVPSKVKTRLR
jgi:hypothetical protein